MSLNNKLNYYPNHYHNKKIVIALSGGIDSVVLLHYYKNHNIRAIHINHNLSPNAQLWQDFCQDFCQKLNIDLQIFNIHLETTNNLEKKARDLRYQTLFDNLQHNELLFTAHHQSDQVETVLLNLCRGSGALGLSGMLEKNNNHHRPFLNKSKAWIESYAKQHKLTHIEDESNCDTRFRRNFMRQKVIPILKTNYPQVEQTISRVAKNMQKTQQLITDLAKIDIEKYNIQTGNTLNIGALQQLKSHRIINVILYHLHSLKFSTPNKKVLEQIIQSLNAKNDTQTLICWGDIEVQIFKGFLYFLPKNKPVRDCEFFKQLKNNNGFNIKYRKDIQRVKFENKSHSQSIKKLLQEYNIPPWERDNLRFYYIFDELIAIEKIGIIQHFNNSEARLR